jgi:hypothetical protein
MDLKKLGKALLFPHIAIMIILVPVATVLLVGSMVFIGTESVIAYISYVLAAYTLTVWCFKIPKIIKYFKTFKDENKYARRWQDDVRLRVNVSLFASLAWNALYGLFQLWLGFYHHTFWFYSLGAYYILLAVVRFFVVRHTATHKSGEKMREELIKYRACGWVFLAMNLMLTVMVFFMIYWNRTFVHDEITTIAMAAYTFASLALAIINIVKYRKYNSPIYTATKSISLAAASVSILTLEATMLQTFGGETVDDLTRKLFLGLTGGAVAAFIIVMSVYMIYISTKKLALLKDEAISKTKEDEDVE